MGLVGIDSRREQAAEGYASCPPSATSPGGLGLWNLPSTCFYPRFTSGRWDGSQVMTVLAVIVSWCIDLISASTPRDSG